MAQRLADQARGTQTESGKIRFIQLLRDSDLAETAKIFANTKDSWQMGQLSFNKHPSVRWDAMLSELIPLNILKSNIESGEVSLALSGLKNPLLLKPENSKLFESTLEFAMHHQDSRFQVALIKNPEVTREILLKLFENELKTELFFEDEYKKIIKFEGRRNRDVILDLLGHSLFPLPIKLMHSQDHLFGNDIYLKRKSAQRGITVHNYKIEKLSSPFDPLKRDK